jgi:geranylgeranyl diphosphate synthase, type I
VLPVSSPVDLAAVFSRYRDALDVTLREAIPSGSEVPELYEFLRYHLGWLDAELKTTRARAGKLIRPTLCLLSCEAVGADFHLGLPAAAALELLHNFSLIHDDVEDRGLERRGRPTVVALWGEPLAINAGDAMLILSQLVLTRAADNGLSAEQTLAMLVSLNECCLRLTEGQHLDLRLEGDPALTREQYFRLVEGKTAALLGCSARLGALSGSATRERASAFQRFGFNLGVGFQIQDDVLGIWGETMETGKPAAADVYGHKVTLPVIDALLSADKVTADRIASVYALTSPSQADVDEVVHLLDGLGVRERAEAEAQRYVEQALRHLESAKPLPSAEAEIVALTTSLLGRKS